MLEVFWTIASLVTLVTGTVTIIARISSGRLGKKMAENSTTELTEADRNLLRRHIRVLEENTASNKKGRP